MNLILLVMCLIVAVQGSTALLKWSVGGGQNQSDRKMDRELMDLARKVISDRNKAKPLLPSPSSIETLIAPSADLVRCSNIEVVALGDGSSIVSVADVRRPLTGRVSTSKGWVVPRADEVVVAATWNTSAVSDSEWAKFEAPTFIRRGIARPEYTTHERLVDSEGRKVEFTTDLLPMYEARFAAEDAEKAAVELERETKREERRRGRREKRAMRELEEELAIAREAERLEHHLLEEGIDPSLYADFT